MSFTNIIIFHPLSVLLRHQLLDSALSSPILPSPSECVSEPSFSLPDRSTTSWFGQSIFFPLQCLLSKVSYKTLVVSIVKREATVITQFLGYSPKITKNKIKWVGLIEKSRWKFWTFSEPNDIPFVPKNERKYKFKVWIKLKIIIVCLYRPIWFNHRSI